MELKKKLKDYLLDLKEEVSAEGFQGESLNKQGQDMHRNILTGMRTDLRSLKQTQKEREVTQRNMELEVRRQHDRACYNERRRAERVLREMKDQFDVSHSFLSLQRFLFLRCNVCLPLSIESSLRHSQSKERTTMMYRPPRQAPN